MTSVRRALPMKIASPPQQEPVYIIRMRDVVMCVVFLGLWILVIPSFVMSIYAVSRLASNSLEDDLRWQCVGPSPQFAESTTFSGDIFDSYDDAFQQDGACTTLYAQAYESGCKNITFSVQDSNALHGVNIDQSYWHGSDILGKPDNETGLDILIHRNNEQGDLINHVVIFINPYGGHITDYTILRPEQLFMLLHAIENLLVIQLMVDIGDLLCTFPQIDEAACIAAADNSLNEEHIRRALKYNDVSFNESPCGRDAYKFFQFTERIMDNILDYTKTHAHAFKVHILGMSMGGYAASGIINFYGAILTKYQPFIKNYFLVSAGSYTNAYISEQDLNCPTDGVAQHFTESTRMIRSLLPKNSACQSVPRNFSTFVVTETTVDESNCQPGWSEIYYNGLKSSGLTTPGHHACIVKRPERQHVWTKCDDQPHYIGNFKKSCILEMQTYINLMVSFESPTPPPPTPPPPAERIITIYSDIFGTQNGWQAFGAGIYQMNGAAGDYVSVTAPEDCEIDYLSLYCKV